MTRRAACLLLLAAAAPAWAAPPADELLRRVPGDAALCVVVRDLREHVAALKASPWVARLLGSRTARQLVATAEARQLALAEAVVSQATGLSAQDLLDDVLGDAMAFAYRPGPGGAEAALFLVWAKDPAKLAGMVRRLTDAQVAAGDLEGVTELTHRDQPYSRRRKGGDGKDEFVLVSGPLLAVSSSEDAVRGVIDRGKDAESGPLAGRLRSAGLDKALAVAWLNPRAFDAELAAKAASAKPAEARFAAATLAAWKALDGVGLSLAPGRGLEVALTVQARPADLPPPLARVVAAASGRSAVWDRVPADALFAAGGKLPLPELADLLGEFLADDARRQVRSGLEDAVSFLGRDRLGEVLAAVGPDWGGCVFPAEGGGWLPPWAAAVRLGGDPAVSRGLADGLNTLALLGTVAHNRGRKDPTRLRTDRRGDTDVRSFENDRRFPEGFRPAFGVRGGWLIVASSPAAWSRFADAKPAAAPPGGGVPVARLSVAGLAAHLRANAGRLVEAFAGKGDTEKSADMVARLVETLELFDRVELTARGGGGLTVFSLSLVPAATARP